VQTAVRFEMVQLPPGKIALADKNGKSQEQEIKPIWIGKYEVTWDEYDIFWQMLDVPERERQRIKWTRTKSPYFPPDGGFGHDGYPVSCIHVNAAQKYCAWLSQHTGKRFRLPTEAEWEYACRAGGPPLKPDANGLDKVAWFQKNAEQKPHPVGKKSPNAWGLHDMLGNVAEYVIRDPKDETGLV